MACFADNLKYNFTQLKKIGTKDVSDWIFTTWLLNSLFLEYNFFQIMLINNSKANQAKEEKMKVEFNFILEQILNFDL